MVRLFSAMFLVLAGTCVLLMPELRSGSYDEAWKALAPNLAAEALGLSLAVLFAEYYLKRFRAADGKAKLAPMLMKRLGPAAVVGEAVIRATEYTPKEFKAIHLDYVKGGFDPVHLPKEFVERINAAIKTVPPEEFRRAADAAKRANEFAGKFAALLEEEHILLLESTVTTWEELAEAVAKAADTAPRDLAESYLDAHDDFMDVLTAFSFKEILRKLE